MSLNASPPSLVLGDIPKNSRERDKSADVFYFLPYRRTSSVAHWWRIQGKDPRECHIFLNQNWEVRHTRLRHARKGRWSAQNDFWGRGSLLDLGWDPPLDKTRNLPNQIIDEVFFIFYSKSTTGLSWQTIYKLLRNEEGATAATTPQIKILSVGRGNIIVLQVRHGP